MYLAKSIYHKACSRKLKITCDKCEKQLANQFPDFARWEESCNNW